MACLFWDYLEHFTKAFACNKFVKSELLFF